MKKTTLLFLQTLLPFYLLAQNLVSITPNYANAGQTLNVTITGANTHFIQGSGTSIDFGFNQGSGTVINFMNIVNNTTIQANITVPALTFTGDYDVYAFNSIDGYLSLNNGFHVNGLPPPSIASVNPNTANSGQTLNVTITGANTHFNQGSGTIIDFGFNQGSGTVVNFMNIVNNTTIQANITVPVFTVTGDYDVYAYNGIDGFLSLNNGFHVNGLPPPSLVSVNPNIANAGQTLNVTITGANTHFTQGSSTIVDFSFNQGSGTVVNFMNVINSTTIQANITVPLNTLIGYYDVYVIDDIDGFLVLVNGFYVGNTGVEDFNKNLSLTIYPNPTKDKVIIETILSNNIKEGTISIYDMRGRLFLEQPLRDEKTELDLKNLAKGVYVLKLSNGENSIVKKIVKE